MTSIKLGATLSCGIPDTIKFGSSLSILVGKSIQLERLSIIPNHLDHERNNPFSITNIPSYNSMSRVLEYRSTGIRKLQVTVGLTSPNVGAFDHVNNFLKMKENIAYAVTVIRLSIHKNKACPIPVEEE